MEIYVSITCLILCKLPYLIYQNNILLDKFSINTVMAIPFATNNTFQEGNIDIAISPDAYNHISNPWILRINNLRLMRKTSFIEKLGSLSENDLKRVDMACSYFLGLTDKIEK